MTQLTVGEGNKYKLSWMSGFAELGLMDDLVASVTAMGWILPRPVQQEAIPLMLGGGDVLCAAETGSGKTGAFCLPIIQLTWEAKRLAHRVSTSQSSDGGSLWRLDENDAMLNARLSPDGLVLRGHDPASWAGARSVLGVREGRWYFEGCVVESAGVLRFGWSTSNATLELGTDSGSYGFGSTGKKSHGGRFDSYGVAFDVGDIIGCGFDQIERRIHFSVNGIDHGVAFDAARVPKDAVMYPAACVRNGAVRLNFSAPTFLPAGFSPAAVAVGQAKGPPRAAAPWGPRGVVVAPTGELARQLHRDIQRFAHIVANPSVNVAGIAGACARGGMIKDVRAADVIVGTPGKLVELLTSRVIPMHNVGFFVLDEADELVERHHREIALAYAAVVEESKASKVQVCMYSATLHTPAVVSAAARYCPRAAYVDLRGRSLMVSKNVRQCVYLMDHTFPIAHGYRTDGVHAKDGTGDENLRRSECIKMSKPAVLLRLLEAYSMDHVIVFCRTQGDCERLESYLTSMSEKTRGEESLYSSLSLHGGLPAAVRARRLDSFKAGGVRMLIATDAASRGVDVPGLSFVVNMTLPATAEDYVHRVGRVGRAGCTGMAVSIVAREKEKVWFHTCEKNPNCVDTRLAAAIPNPSGSSPAYRGPGCCIWLDELSMLGIVERALEMEIAVMDTHMKGLPEGPPRGEDRTHPSQTNRPLFMRAVLADAAAVRAFWCTQQALSS